MKAFPASPAFESTWSVAVVSGLRENATRRLSGMTYTQDWIFILAQTILFMFSDQDRPVRLPSQAAEHGEAADLIIVQFGRGSHKRARHDDGVLPHHLLKRMIPAERKLSCGI